MTVPGALEIIRDAVAQLKGTDVLIGAGTVLDAQTARAAIIAGAQFVVGPVFDLETVRLCNSYGVVVMPGALTPTEIFQAWKSGADVVKVFPGQHRRAGLSQDDQGAAAAGRASADQGGRLRHRGSLH